MLDVCVEKIHHTVVLFLRNAFIYEEGGEQLEFCQRLFQILYTKRELLLEKNKALIPLIFFKIIRLLSVTTVLSELSAFNHQLLKFAEFIWSSAKNSKFYIN